MRVDTMCDKMYSKSRINMYVVEIFTILYAVSISCEDKYLMISKCCDLDEYYSVTNKQCQKLSNVGVNFTSHDYLVDVLDMLDLDDVEHPNLVSPSNYNISKIERPNCSSEILNEHVLIKIPQNPEEVIDYSDYYANIKFSGGVLIDYPSHDLFEIKHYHTFHNAGSYCIDSTFKIVGSLGERSRERCNL